MIEDIRREDEHHRRCDDEDLPHVITVVVRDRGSYMGKREVGRPFFPDVRFPGTVGAHVTVVNHATTVSRSRCLSPVGCTLCTTYDRLGIIRVSDGIRLLSTAFR